MESIVFANSPLAEYLEGNGQAEEDWGIEPVDEKDDSSEIKSIFAPALSFTVKSRISTNDLKPLKSQASSDHKARFYELFSKAIDSRLSRNENSRFLERFRYTIVASQLLNGHVNTSHYDRKPDTDQLFSGEDPVYPFAGARYWVGSGGFVLVTSMVLHWVFRGTGGKMGFSKARAMCALLFSLTVAVFLFTQARRKWLRSLRMRAVEYAVMFVDNSQTFDILASNAITLIQEVELVSRGYRLSTPLPPITRLERDTQTRRCARLRKSVLAALEQAIPPHQEACELLRNLVQEEDMERYFDIYDIQTADLEESEFGLDTDEFEDMQSLKALKALLHRLHTIRRVFLCSLMAIETDGCHADYAKWNLVVEQLKRLGNVVADLAGELKRISTEEEEFFIPPTPKDPLSPVNEKYRGQLRKLNSLSQALRGLQAKMHVLREESDRTLQESSDLSGFGNDLLTHYDSIGADLRGLVDEWENARAMLVDRRERANSNSPRNSKSLDGSTLVGDTPRNSGLFNKDGSWADAAGLSLLSSPQENKFGEGHDSGAEEVYEAVAEPAPPRPKSILTREERIKKVQGERAKMAEKRKSAEAGLALQKELQNVLINRPPPRQRYAVRHFSR